jgi:predicted RNase H-like HicB family nuclease
MAHGRQFTVTLTPDLEDGGYTVQCNQEPWAISQGETEQEALDNIIDALELGLEHERELQAAKEKAQAGRRKAGRRRIGQAQGAG